jgi:hypothetical protein
MSPVSQLKQVETPMKDTEPGNAERLNCLGIKLLEPYDEKEELMPSEKQRKEESSDTDDAALRIRNARRMMELTKLSMASVMRNKSGQVKTKPSDREVLLGALRDRGDEVLVAAEASYPKETAVLIPKLADLVRQKKVDFITGGELLQFLRSLGMRVSVPTSISVEDHGKFVSLSEKLKSQH